MSNRRDGCEVAIDELLSVARRETLMLAIATGALDDDAAAIAAARLRWAIDAVRPLIAAEEGAHRTDMAMDALSARRTRPPGAASDDRAREQLDQIANRAQRWLVGEPPRPPPELARLVARAVRRDNLARRSGRAARRGATGINADHASLVELDLDRLDLARISLAGARLVEVSLRGATGTAADARGSRWQRCALDAADLTLAVLAEARLEHCDLSLAKLTGTSWHCSAVAHTRLRRATLIDARLDRASFTDCDLRGANLAVAGSPHVASLAGARFVRCDLRDTDWRGRELAGASFVDCAVLGARGAPALASTG